MQQIFMTLWISLHHDQTRSSTCIKHNHFLLGKPHYNRVICLIKQDVRTMPGTRWKIRVAYNIPGLLDRWLKICHHLCVCVCVYVSIKLTLFSVTCTLLIGAFVIVRGVHTGISNYEYDYWILRHITSPPWLTLHWKDKHSGKNYLHCTSWSKIF